MGEAIDIRAANASGNQANHGALAAVKKRSVGARVIEVNTTKANGATTSTAAPNPTETNSEEPFTALSDAGRIIEPPFDLLTLAMLCENSSELNQVVEAMEVNIEAYGHRFISRLRTSATDKSDIPDNVKPPAEGEKPKDLPPEVLAAQVENAKLVNFFNYCTDESFVAFRRRLRRDLEMTGNAYFEIIRNTDGEIQAFTHMPSYQMRLGRLDEDPRLVDRKIVELQPDGSVEVKKIKEWKRFRTFAQSRAVYGRTLHTLGSKVRWFKQFGDPRVLNKKTGDFGTAQQPVPEGDEANEVYHIKIYSSRSPYGIPRYIGNLLSIFGDRAAEEINYITFRNNNIPSMVVAVSNGSLTQGTIDRIESFVQSQIQGSDNYSKFLIIEGEPFGDEGEDGGQVKIDVKPLTAAQHKDALFQNYSDKNQDKIRRAFRLPPIFVGRADDYSKATAESSRRVADEQVFSPERDEFDNTMNRIIFPEMDIVYHKFKSNSPNTTDNSELVKILAGAEKTGGMTPRIARHVLQEVLGQDLPEFPKDFNADVPFSLTMAEAVKNMADPAEPGQQVTAIKNVLKGFGLGPDATEALEIDEDDSILDVVRKVATVQKSVERLWKKQAEVEATKADEG
jgi:PBSX family phage portal protein